MKLSAVYIHAHYLYDGPKIINLGGRNYYDYSIDSDHINIFVKHKNENFIEDFWGSDVSIVSAIVGENGTGKTSLLKELIMTFERFREDTLHNNIAFIYENEDGYKIYTHLKLKDNGNLITDVQKIKYEYYSPLIDLDLKDISSSLNLSNKYDSTLEEFHLSNLERQVVFNYSKLSEQLQGKYTKNFPVIKGLIIKGRPQYKIDFEKPYALSDLQIQMSNALKTLWLKYPNNIEKFDQFSHSQNNLIKDVEVNILAILIVNNTYSMVEGSGYFKYATSEEILAGDFLEVLMKYKEQYISAVNRDLYDYYIESEKLEFARYIRENIRGGSFDVYKSISDVLELFDGIEEFYNLALSSFHMQGFSNYDNNLIFNNSTKISERTKNLQNLITSYRKLLKIFEKTVIYRSNISLLEFSYLDVDSMTKQKMSTGEKALLNLYSSTYEYVNSSQHNSHKWENYIFLLDEADLGYHPEWKKKFIDSIVETLPNILSEIVSFKSLQILFTTHDPLTLSDIPNANVVYLQKQSNYVNILEIDSEERPSKTFGANISDLLSDSFFVNEGLIGDFAKKKIEKLIEELNDLLDKKLANQSIDISDHQKRNIRIKINIIDEPIIKNKLLDMFFNIFESEIVEEINDLEARLIYLKTLKR